MGVKFEPKSLVRFTEFAVSLGDRPFGKLSFWIIFLDPALSLPTLLFDEKGVSRGARAPAA